MTNFDQKTLIPTEIADIQVLMWTYRDYAAGMVGYGTISALATAFDDAAHHGDGDDHSPDKVWALTTRGPIPAPLVVSPDTGGMVRVSVKWIEYPRGSSSSVLFKRQAWYPIRDI